MPFLPVNFYGFVIGVCLIAFSKIGVCADVYVASLPALSLNTLGLQTGRSDLWRHTDKTTLFSQIDAVKNRLWSPVSADILKNILITDTAGSSSDFESEAELSFLEKRINALLHLGFFDEVLKIMNLVPASAKIPSLQKNAFWAALFSQHISDACPIIDLSDFEAETDKARILCFLERNQHQKAALSYDVYQEQADRQPDVLFDALGHSLFLGLSFELKKLPVLDMQHIPLLPFVPEAVALVTLDNQPHWVLKAITLNARYPVSVRIQAAEKIGLTDKLIELYQMGEARKSNIQRVDLYARIQTKQPQVKQVQAFIQSVRKSDTFIALAPLITRVLDHVPMTSAYRDIAFDAVQAYALTGQSDKAKAWYALLPDKTDKSLVLMPLMGTLGESLQPNAAFVATFCQKNQPACQHFLDSFSGTLEMDFDTFKTLSAQSVSVIPDVALTYIQSLFRQNQIGVGLMTGLIILADSPDFNRPVLSLVQQNVPPEVAQRLEIERMCR